MQLVGTKEQPSLRDELAEVKAIALRSEKELHPNGGSSLRDDVRIVGSAGEGVDRARDTRRATRRGHRASGGEWRPSAATDVQRIQGAVRGSRTSRSAWRTRHAEKRADWLELLAENGGPDLRPHLPTSRRMHTVPAAASRT